MVIDPLLNIGIAPLIFITAIMLVNQLTYHFEETRLEKRQK